MKNIILACSLIFFIAVISSCEKNDELIIRDENFKTIIIENSKNPLGLILDRRTDYLSKINNWGFYDGEIIFKYSWNEKNNKISGNDLEIIFSRDRIGSLTLMKPENCLIGAKLINEQLKAYFILWQNKGFDPIKTTKRKYWSNGFVEYYDEDLDSNLKVFSPVRGTYNWEISDITDSLISNLDLSMIKKLFPKFNGKYIQIKIDTIFLDYQYPVETLEFYNSIKFSNFKLGYIRDYYQMIKFVKDSIEIKEDGIFLKSRVIVK